MFKLTRLVVFHAGLDAPARAQALARMQSTVELPGVLRGFAQATLPGTLNGGDAIWHLQFADAATYHRVLDSAAWGRVQDALAPLQAQVESVAYAGVPQGSRAPGLRDGVYRTLLVSATRPDAEARHAQFAHETLAMPQYIGAIRNWQLSPVAESSGSRRWTHVWEQEYENLAALQGPYMLHPYHWAHVDRWFDWESPDWIVDRHMCHTFCPLARSVLAPEAS